MGEIMELSKDVKSNEQDWNSIYTYWNDARMDELFLSLEEVYASLIIAKAGVDLLGDIGSMYIGVNQEAILENQGLKGKIKKFTLDIHEELVEEIDDPFKNQILVFTETAYLLDPNDNTLSASEYDGSNSKTVFNLKTVTASMFLDAVLKKDYQAKLSALDVDVPSVDISDELEAFGQWRKEIPFDDMKEIDRKLFEGLKKTEEWNVNFAKGDPNYPFELADTAKIYYDMLPYLVIKDPNESGGAYYSSSKNGIYINIVNERTNARNPYTTFFHESAHMLDNSFVEIEQGKDPSKSTSIYISSSYSQYSDQFYNDLISDVHDYLDNYDLKTTKTGDLKLEIKKELSGDQKSETSDIFGAVTDNEYVGSYGHWDEKTLWVTDSYWDYSDSKGKPAKDPLVKEAFAHFTEISVTQDPEDLADLKKYFPNAYETYVNMMKEYEN